MKKTVLSTLCVSMLVSTWSCSSFNKHEEDDFIQDDISPIVSLLSPGEGDTVNGILILEAEASDNKDIAAVWFYLSDSVLVSDSTIPYLQEWTIPYFIPEVTSQVFAKALDTYHNVGYSDTVTIYLIPSEIPDTLSPIVTIIEPSEGELIAWNTLFKVVVEENREVKEVSFLINDSLLTKLTDEPYEVVLPTLEYLPQGTLSLSATAEDNSGNMGFSDTIIIHLQAPVYAVYAADGDTSNEENGIWQPSLIAWKSLLDTLAFDWVEVTFDEINDGIMQSGFDGLIMPGGWSGTWKSQIENAGNTSIRQFVNNGGVYIGVSAGAYYASDTIIWEGTTYDNPLDIFLGVAEGPIPEIAPWPDYTMTDVQLNQNHPINEGISNNLSVLYYGEPFFYTLASGNMEIVATYNYNDEPAIITFEFGNGRGLLLGPHLEIEEDSDFDGTTWGNWLYDVESDWPLLINSFYWLHNQTE